MVAPLPPPPPELLSAAGAHALPFHFRTWPALGLDAETFVKSSNVEAPPPPPANNVVRSTLPDCPVKLITLPLNVKF